MSDWRSYENEGIIFHEFGKSDHRVIKEPISAPVPSMSEVHDITGLTSPYCQIPNNIFKQWNVAEDLELIVEDPNIATLKSADGSDFCNFPGDNISITGDGLGLLGNGKKIKDGFVYTDWDDISDFELEKIFRNCDPALGQGSKMESQSPFSSSTGICGLRDTFDSDLPSSTLELRTTNDVSFHPNSSYLSDDGLVANESIELCSSGYQSLEMITNAEQFDGGRRVGIESALYNGNNLDVMKHLEVQNMSHIEGKNPILSSASARSSFGYVDQKYLSPVSASPDSFPTPILMKQTPYMCSETSSSLRTFKSQFKAQGISSPYLDGFTQAASSTATDDMQLKKMGEAASLGSSESSNHGRKQLNDFDQQTGNDRVCMNIQLAGTRVDVSVTQNSFLPSVSDNDMSVKDVTFKQLQDVMAQLDVRTKLCIRDSLYRLARSAEQRHSFSFTSNGKRECNGEVYNKRKLNDSPDHFYVETETNPIDRSIAHLLFHRPSEILPKSDDAILREPHMINHQAHDSIAQMQ